MIIFLIEWAVKNKVEIPVTNILTKDSYEKNPKMRKCNFMK